MKAGAVEFLTKPVREQDLLDAVQIALDRDRKWRENDKRAATQDRRDRPTQIERQSNERTRYCATRSANIR